MVPRPCEAYKSIQNNFIYVAPKSQSHCLSGLYNLYSEQRHPLSLDPRVE